MFQNIQVQVLLKVVVQFDPGQSVCSHTLSQQPQVWWTCLVLMRYLGKT